MYHGVVPSPLEVPDWCFIEKRYFSAQMEYLSRHFRVISLAQAIQELHADRIKSPTAVITFDDGYQNVFDVAYPILRRLGLPATIFLNTAFIGTAKTVWFCTLNHALTRTTQQELLWDGQAYDLSSNTAKSTTSSRLQSILKQYSHQELLDKLAEIHDKLEMQIPDEIPPESHFRMLDNQAIEEMAASGLIEFGAHTANHTILTRIDEEYARQEIESSIQDTRRLTGKPCTLFAYPNGRVIDYNKAIIEKLKTAGIQIAVTTREGPNTTNTPLLELRRYDIGTGVDMATFMMRTHHLL